MGKFLSIFLTTSKYENEYNNLDVPNVSLVKDNMSINYKIDPYKGREYVEIGGIKWATMNIGARKITDYGYYFQWGDIKGYSTEEINKTNKTLYSDTYKYGENESSMTKYNASDGKTVLDIWDDAARTYWGGLWRMPTKEECEILINSTTYLYYSNYNSSGISGYMLTSKTNNENKLFFPFGGKRYWLWDNINTYCHIWTNTLSTNNRERSYKLCLGSGKEVSTDDRYLGFNIRPVLG